MGLIKTVLSNAEREEPDMLLREVIVNIALSEVSDERLIVSIPVVLISNIKLPLFLREPMLV